MKSAVAKVEELLREKNELPLEGDSWMERFRAINVEIGNIKSEVDLETFDDIRILELKRHGSTSSLNQYCKCGHRRGSHGMGDCKVGHESWNKRNRRNDDRCFCSVFIEKAEFERLQAEEEIDLAERKANADHWCETCEDEVDELTVKYECGNCGSEFTYADEGTHRCPDCGKFASKLDGDYCSGCGEEAN